MMVEPRHLDQLLHPMFENEKAYQRDVITKGLGASPGAAVGKLVFTAGGLLACLLTVSVTAACNNLVCTADAGRGPLLSSALLQLPHDTDGWGRQCTCYCL
jgi:pyruvate,orthophosphate dikinase